MWCRTATCQERGSWCTRRSESPHISPPCLVHCLTPNRNPINICGWIPPFIQTPEAFMTLVKQRDEDVTEGMVGAWCGLWQDFCQCVAPGAVPGAVSMEMGLKIRSAVSGVTSTARQKRNMCVEQSLSFWSGISSEHLPSWLGPSPYLCLDIQRY